MKSDVNDIPNVICQSSDRKDVGLNSASNLLDFQNIYISPTLTRNETIDALNLPYKLENALRKNGRIRYIYQLCDISDHDLFLIKGVGRSSVNYLHQVKIKINEKFSADHDEKINEEQNKEDITKSTRSSTGNLFRRFIERSGDYRAIEVIKRRYGLMGGEKQTLQEIGDTFKVTRERIRQIQERAYRRLRLYSRSIKEDLCQVIENTILNNSGVITEEQADELIPHTLGVSKEDGSSILDLLADLHWIQSCAIGGIMIYSSNLDGVDLCTLCDKIISLLKKQHLGLSIDDIIEKIYLFRQIRDTRFNPKSFVQRYFQIDPRIIETEIPTFQAGILYKYNGAGASMAKYWASLIEKIMEKEQVPLHFTEISNKVNDILAESGHEIDVRTIHHILIEDSKFAHTGVRGTYGLTKWGLRKEPTPELIKECIKKAGFPLHWKQIYHYVAKFKDTKTMNIISALETNKNFKKLNNGIYGLHENIN